MNTLVVILLVIAVIALFFDPKKMIWALFIKIVTRVSPQLAAGLTGTVATNAFNKASAMVHSAEAAVASAAGSVRDTLVHSHEPLGVAPVAPVPQPIAPLQKYQLLQPLQLRPGARDGLAIIQNLVDAMLDSGMPKEQVKALVDPIAPTLVQYDREQPQVAPAAPVTPPAA